MPLLLGVWWLLSCASAALPLQAVDVKVDVDGPVAEVVLTQTFRNDSDRAVDATYVFPLHERAAADAVQFEVGGRFIRSRIDERGAAEATFERARDEGRTAMLTTQERPNVFTQHVANIPPHGEVTVELHVVQPAPFIDGRYELVLPLDVAPRFLGPDDDALDLPAVPTYERPDRGWPEGLQVTLDVQLQTALPLLEVTSPSHALLHVERRGDHFSWQARTTPDRDVVLRWTVPTHRVQSGMLVQGDHAVLTIQPPERVPPGPRIPREILWVVDQSCSMNGGPLTLTKASLSRAIDAMGPDDAIQVLAFSDDVRASGPSEPVTDRVRRKAQAWVAGLAPTGGTNLLEGIQAALETPEDPLRERMIVFLTDGQVVEGPRVLGEVVDGIGDARLHVFGVGDRPNRYLLDELALMGRGRTAWLRDGDSVEDVVDRFMELIDAPLLTDLTIDWGDWEVEEPWPRRMPDVHPGQPLHLYTRVSRRGTTPIRVQARVGGGVLLHEIEPTIAADGRAVRSTWAREKIAALEREQFWGQIEEVRDEITRTSLDNQVLSQHTAFVAVDDSALPHPRGTGESAEVIEAVGTRAVILVEDSSRGQILTRETLQRLPNGRSYQSAVDMARGVVGGSNPNMAGVAANENTYMVDGVTVTDPVTGTFSLNFAYRDLEQVELIWAGTPVWMAGPTGMVLNEVGRSGTNSAQGRIGLHVDQGVGKRGPQSARYLDGEVSGPIVRDRLWARLAVSSAGTRIGDRTFEGHESEGRLTWQPNASQRITVDASGHAGQVSRPDERFDQLTGHARARWQWFAGPDTSLDTVLATQRVVLGDADTRTRHQGRVRLTQLDVVDPTGLTHDLTAGVDAEILGWERTDKAPGDLSELDLSAWRIGAFASDRIDTGRLAFDLGARVDRLGGRARTSPRLAVGYHSHDRKLAAHLLWQRSWSGLRLWPLALGLDALPPRVDDLGLKLQAEVYRDLGLSLALTHRDRTGLPTWDGARVDRRVLSSRIGLHKVYSRSWSLQASYTWNQPLGPAASLVQDGTLVGFRHNLDASLLWDLPTDPWRLSVGAVVAVRRGPIDTLAVDPDLGGVPNVPGSDLGLRLTQRIPTRLPVTVHLEGRWTGLTGAWTEDGPVPSVRLPEPPIAGSTGPWISAGVEVEW